MKLSLETLLHRLVGRGNQIALQTPARSDERTPTSIRLKPATKHFLEAQATALNTSVQGLIDLILDGVVEATTDDPTARLRSIRERFFLLMQAHGLDLPSAVELMTPYGFTLSALNNADRLLDLLTPAALDHLADTFHVRSDWVRGATDYAVSADSDVRWYKDVPSMARQLIAHAQADRRPELMFIRRQRADFERAFADNDAGKTPKEPVGVVLRLRRSTPSDTNYTTYQLWEFERWNYWRCREQLKMLIAFCEQARIPIVGHELKEDAISQLLAGKQLPVSLLDRLGSVSWHPDDYASFAFEVRHETAEWLSVAKAYRESSLPGIAVEAGAAPLPDKPWRAGGSKPVDPVR
ncbi:hypothetical protein ACFX58_09440 [Sphingomonas sp. NCPPB 2930]